MALSVIRAPNFEKVSRLVHGFTTREGGSSEGPYASLNLGWATGDDDDIVAENYRLLASAFGIADDRFFSVHQVHENGVLRVEASKVPRDIRAQRADALITDVSNIFLSVRVADCLPILLVDPDHHVVAAVHAGWRGTLAQALPVTLQRMRDDFKTDPGQIQMAVGPAIEKKCYEVALGVAALFQTQLNATDQEVSERGSSARIDLIAINARLAQENGVQREKIWNSGLCSRCDDTRFFSYRRDGRRSGRMIGVIGWSA